MYKIATSLDHYFSKKATCIFTKFGLWAHKLCVKQIPGIGYNQLTCNGTQRVIQVEFRHVRVAEACHRTWRREMVLVVQIPSPITLKERKSFVSKVNILNAEPAKTTALTFLNRQWVGQGHGTYLAPSYQLKQDWFTVSFLFPASCHRLLVMILVGWHSGLILGLHPTNERCRYKITPSLVGWAQT